MSSPNQARRVTAQIFFQGADITGSMRPYFLSATYTDKEADGTEGSETCCYYSPEGSDMVYYSDSASVGAVFDFIDYVPGEGSGAAEED